MKDLSKSEFLSFLYAEKERLHTNFSKPGWSNWAIAGAFVALLLYGFNLLTTSITLSLCVDWEAVLMLFISFLSVTIIGRMVYSLLFPKVEIYYSNRISTFKNESPTLEYIISGLSFLTIAILLIISRNYSWILFVFVFLSLDKLVAVYQLFYRRNELIPSGSRYDFIPKVVLSNTKYSSISTNWIYRSAILISVVLLTFTAIFSSRNYIIEFGQYLHEVQIAAVFLGFWVLIYIFFQTNSTPKKMLNGIDNIIDRYAYGSISQQDAMEELMCLRYGSGVNQVVKNDKTFFFDALRKLEPINAQLDAIIKTIDEGKQTFQLYSEWLSYYKNEYPKILDAISKGKKLIKKISEIDNIPNSATYSDDIKSLIDLTQSGLNKIEATQNKFIAISERFEVFKKTNDC